MKTLKSLIVCFMFLNLMMASEASSQNALYPFNHGYVVSSTSSKKRQDRVKESSSVQGPSYDKTAALAQTNTQPMDESKIRAAMDPYEYKNFEQAELYVETNSRYTLGPDDVIDVVVMRHPEVSGQYVINKEGKIQYEFIGDVVVTGLTKQQAQNVLAKRLSVYILRPEINIKISGYNSKMVYVIGEVANPGRVPMRGDTITVRDALLAAGLPLITAATDNSTIFTPAPTGNVVRKRVNITALLYQGDLRENYILHTGDCLYVPATFLAKAMRAISPVTQPVANIAGTGGAARYAF